jgi:hypothetical protein
MSPTDGSASWENVCSDMSTTRPGVQAWRSSTVQVTAAPLDRSVTVTTVPKVNVGLAQVPGLAPYHEATPVSVCPEAAWSAGAGGDGGGSVGAVAAGTVRVTGIAGCTGVVVVVVLVVVVVRDIAAYAATIAVGMAHRDCASELALAGVEARVSATARARCVVVRSTTDDARPGVASRSSGTTTTATQSANRTSGRAPAVLLVLRPPPFFWGHRVDRGVDGESRGASCHRQTRTANAAAQV